MRGVRAVVGVVGSVRGQWCRRYEMVGGGWVSCVSWREGRWWGAGGGSGSAGAVLHVVHVGMWEVFSCAQGTQGNKG